MKTTSVNQQHATAVISQITAKDDKFQEYVQEAEECLTVGAYRAAIVLGWCATVYHLYRIIESNGLDLFRQSYNKKHRGDYEIKPKDDIDQIRLKVRDSDLLEICYHDLGLLSTDEHYRLDLFRGWRNQSAHPTGRSPRPGDVQWLFADIMGPFLARLVDIKYFPVEYVKPYFDPEADDPLELRDYEAELLVERVHPDNHMHLMGELLKAYLSPDHYEVHDNVSKLRRFLAERLDTTKREQANQQLAKLLARPKKRSDQPVREVVFWPELKQLESNDRRTVVRRFTDEFAELIGTAQYARDDADILPLALAHIEAQERERIIRDLLVAFQDRVIARPLTDSDKVILETLVTYAEGQAREELARLLSKMERSSK
jgi:hypothetical protein